MIIKKQDILLIGAVGIGIIVGSFILLPIFGEKIIILSIGGAVVAILCIQFETYRRVLQKLDKQYTEQKWNYRQIHSLFSIHSVLKLKYPLPTMVKPTILPDSASVLVDLVYSRKPKLIYEVGSGLSTVLMAYCLKELKQGKIISNDHIELYANVTNQNLEKHGLSDFATVSHAPLKDMDMNGKTWNWYDLPDLDKLPGKIDMLVVDGPPWKLQHLARYPALPVLFKYLSDNAVIILDDGNRPDEKEIVKLWKKEYDCFEGRHLDTQREIGFFERKK